MTTSPQEYLNGWCRRGTHTYCPDAPTGGLIGAGPEAIFYRQIVGSCTCSCHRPDRQMSFEEAANG